MAKHTELTTAWHKQKEEIQNYIDDCASVAQRWIDALCRELDIKPGQTIGDPPHKTLMIYCISAEQAKKGQKNPQPPSHAIHLASDGNCSLMIVVTLGTNEQLPFRSQGFMTTVKITGNTTTGKVATVKCDNRETTFGWVSARQELPELAKLAKEVTGDYVDKFQNEFQSVLNGTMKELPADALLN